MHSSLLPWAKPGQLNTRPPTLVSIPPVFLFCTLTQALVGRYCTCSGWKIGKRMVHSSNPSMET